MCKEIQELAIGLLQHVVGRTNYPPWQLANAIKLVYVWTGTVDVCAIREVLVRKVVAVQNGIGGMSPEEMASSGYYDVTGLLSEIPQLEADFGTMSSFYDDGDTEVGSPPR